jgi:hypothetical protein
MVLSKNYEEIILKSAILFIALAGAVIIFPLVREVTRIRK